MEYKPHPYQVEATQRILDLPAVGLWLSMGLGKTVSTLTALSRLQHDELDINRVLVIAPLRVARDTWARECLKWDHLQYLTVSKVIGTKKERLAALEAPADIYVTNREQVPWLVEHYGRRWPFDCVVIDEASSFKSASANRFKALKKVRPFIKRIIELTGTPSPNTLMDLWAQAYLLDRGERLGKTIGEYRRRYFRPGLMNGHVVYRWDALPGAEDEIQQKLSDICFSMRQEDWLALPPRTDNILDVELPAEALKLYKRLERDLVLQLVDGNVTAASAAVLMNKLLQMANGAVYDENGEAHSLHDAKLEALDEVVAESGSVLVFYSYKHDLERIRKRYPNARELRTENDIADWNAGSISLLLAHPASSGHGLNLQEGGNTACWFGLPWSLELYLQANARLHRQGQKHPVIIHHILAKGTADHLVMKALAKKEIRQDALLEALKRDVIQ